MKASEITTERLKLLANGLYSTYVEGVALAQAELDRRVKVEAPVVGSPDVCPKCGSVDTVCVSAGDRHDGIERECYSCGHEWDNSAIAATAKPAVKAKAPVVSSSVQCDCVTSTSLKGCSSQSRNWLCTRPNGHSGDHVACGTDEHNMFSWPKEATKPAAPTPAEKGSCSGCLDYHPPYCQMIGAIAPNDAGGCIAKRPSSSVASASAKPAAPVVETTRFMSDKKRRLAQYQPCGCKICICESDDKCNGCGPK